VPGKLTFWRRRITAIVVVAGIAVGIWVALADGTTTGPLTRHSRADNLSIAQLAGERIIAGFSGPHPSAKVKAMIAKGEAAGVILFDENLGTRHHARRLIRKLEAINRPKGLRSPLLVMIDQEGGLVKRLSGPPNASAQQMGQRGERYSRRQGAKTAKNLKDVGVNVNLAPVLDVGRSGSEIESEQRSFGSTPGRVIRTAVPFAGAMQRHGIAATGKHFPGLGAARGNTDVSVEKIHLSRSKLRHIDEKPYGPFAERHGKLVMISNAIYTHFSHRPAAFTKSIATGELRGRIGFGGVSITDTLEATSVKSFAGPAKAGVAAAKAGVDLLLYTHDDPAAKAGHALRERLRKGSLKRSDFERSADRVLRLRAKLGK
jgi:beta-N-acetylhexosaminidase